MPRVALPFADAAYYTGGNEKLLGGISS